MADADFDEVLGRRPELNPYDEVANYLNSTSQAELKAAARSASKISPDQAGKNAELSDKTGIPADVVHRKFEIVNRDQQFRENDYDRISRNPGFATWMKDPGNFAIAQDDLQNAGFLEWLITAPVKAYNQGVAQVEFGKLRYQSIFNVPNPETEKRLKLLREQMRTGGDLGVESFGGGMVTGAFQQFPNILGGLAAGAKTGVPSAVGAGAAAMIAGQLGPQVALPEEVATVPAAALTGYYVGQGAGSAAFGLEQEAGHAYEEFSQMKDVDGRPLDKKLSKVLALAAGGINAGLEATQINLLVKTIPGMKNLASGAARGLVIESLQVPTVRTALTELAKQYGEFLTKETAVEIAQRAVTIVAGEMTKAMSDGNFKARTAAEIATDLASEGAGAVQAFALLGVPGAAMHGHQSYREVQAAQAREQWFLEIGKTMEESKVRERYEGKAMEMVDAMAKDSDLQNVYINPQVFAEYFQSKGIDPRVAAQAIMGDTAEFDVAQQAGHDMAIPLPIYAARVAPTEHNAFFAKELKFDPFDPADMNVREAEEYQTNLTEQMKQVEAQQQVEQDNRVLDTVSASLEQSGFEKKTATVLATQMQAFFETQAQRSGKFQSAFDLFKQYVLNIGRPDLTKTPQQVLNQPVYHGTPHEFDRFETQKIGSGEGNQAYGWGLYFASNKKVAQWYRDQLVQPHMNVMVGGKNIDDVIADHLMEPGHPGDSAGNYAASTAGSYLKDSDGNIKEAISMVESWIEHMGPESKQSGVEYMNRVKTLLEEWDKIGVTVDEGKKGRIYHVEIPEDKHFLDYDASMGLQPPHVQKLMEQMMEHSEKQFLTLSKRAMVVSKNLAEVIPKYSVEETRHWSVMQREDFDSYAAYDHDLKQMSPTFKDIQRARDWLDATRRNHAESNDIVLALREIADGGDDMSDLGASMTEISKMITQSYNADSKLLDTNEWHDFSSVRDLAESFQTAYDNIMVGRGLYEYVTQLASDNFGDPTNPVTAWYNSKVVADNHGQHPMFTPEETASKYLLAHGVEGIKYLDGSSRSKKTDTGRFNYVVFDDSKVQITKYEQERRGTMMKFGSREFSIHFLEQADLSTFLHESGHLYLEILTDMLQSGQMSNQMRDDYRAILQFIGTEPGGQISVESHEKFARAIEAYFMEGKAPSIGLRQSFARFRAWLMAIYRKLTALDVRLNTEVRDVFSRMFATDIEIDAAKSESEVRPLFASATDVGMTDAEFKNYVKTVERAHIAATEAMQQKLIDEWTREQKDWWKEESERVRDAMVQEWMSDPGHVALSLISDGNLPDGSVLPEGQTAFKLDGPSVIKEFGPASKSAITKELRSMDAYRQKGGVHPNVAAESFGLRTGAALVREMVRANEERTGLADAVHAEMVSRHGDTLRDGTIADKAMAAVLNEKQSEIAHIELKAITKKRNEVHPFVATVKSQGRKEASEGIAMLRGIPPLSVFQRTAKDRVSQMIVRNIRPQVYLGASRRAASRAMEAVARKDFTIAAMAKQQQIYNMEMYRTSRNALDQIETITRYVNSFHKNSVRARIGKAGHDYLEQIDGLLQKYDFSPMSMADEKRRDSLRTWLERQARSGQEADMDPRVIEEAQRKSYKTLMLDELVGINDMLKYIEHLADTKNKLLQAHTERRLDVVRTMVIDSIVENTKNLAKRTVSTHAPQDAAGRLLKSWLAEHRKLSSYARQLDGYKDGGLLWEYVVRPFNDAQDAKIVELEKLGPKIKALFERYQGFMDSFKSSITTGTQGLVQAGMYKREYIAEINDSMSFMNRLMVAMNLGNEDNRTKLRTGHGWSDAQLATIVEPLTKEDWDFVQGMWDLINSYWPKIEAKEKRVNGVAPEKVEADAYNTPFGEIAGGYFPLKYNDELSPTSYAHIASEQAEAIMRGYYTRSTTKRGFTKERVKGVNQPVRLDFGVIFEHLNEVIHDFTHHEALIDVNKIIGAHEVQQALISSIGREGLRQMQNAVTAIAAGDVPARSAFERATNWLRSGVSVAAMGWNLATGVMQGLGVTQSIVRVGPMWFAKGLGKWIADAATMENTVRWIHSVSTTMRDRSHSQSREVQQLRGTLEGREAQTAFKNTYYYFITKGQMLVDVPTWLAGYEKGMAQFDGDEVKAIALADQGVLDSQSSGYMKDLAGVQRGNNLKQLFTTFYSYFSATYNLSAESVNRASIKNPLLMGRAAVDMFLLYSVPATLGWMIKDALRGNDPPDGDEFWTKFWREQAAYLASSMIGPRELASAIQGYYGYEGPAGTRFYAAAAGAIKQASQGDLDEAAVRAVNQTAGILFHYPAAALDKMARGYVAWSEGNDSALALLFGPSNK